MPKMTNEEFAEAILTGVDAFEKKVQQQCSDLQNQCKTNFDQMKVDNQEMQTALSVPPSALG